jgi:hypothetical protein
MLSICHFRENPLWEMPYFSYGRKPSYVHTCTVKQYNIATIRVLHHTGYNLRLFSYLQPGTDKITGKIFQILCQNCIRCLMLNLQRRCHIS